MQPIDALTLHHFAGELDVKLADGKVNKVQQASHHELLLHLWVGGEAGRQKLYINIRPEYAFCALLEETSFLTFPQKAPNFCMVLRKHLLSARIKRVVTLADERVLNIEMENYNELGQQVQLVLSLELMGKNSNIILYDEELKLILGCAHGVSEEMSRKREISVGYPYVPPPRPVTLPLRFAAQHEVIEVIKSAWETQQPVEDALTKAYSGVGKAILADVFQYHTEADKAYEVIQDLFQGIHLYTAVKRDKSRFSLLANHQQEADWEPTGSINRMIQHYFMSHFLENLLKGEKQQFRQILKAQEKKLTKRRQELEKTSPEAIEALKKAGDLLTIAYSQQASTTGSRITVTDFETGDPIELELDPHLNLSENAQQYYRRYKKAQARQIMANEQTAQLENALQFIEELYAALDRANSPEEMTGIREDMEVQGWIKPLTEPRKKEARKPPSRPITVMSSDGFAIYVGQNGVQNEQIVGKLSRVDDVWLHAYLIPGSHVLVKADKQEIPDQTLVEAASLAAYYSQARGSVNVPVVYTRSQYVRKIPNSYPGHVNYTHEKAINVTPEADLIERLLQQQSLAQTEA
jgi:predicted ribosome quality control (RQC) complex YloA/Tae2 family protein